MYLTPARFAILKAIKASVSSRADSIEQEELVDAFHCASHRLWFEKIANSYFNLLRERVLAWFLASKNADICSALDQFPDEQ